MSEEHDPLHDREAERAVLGALLMDTEVIPRVMSILGESPDAFFTTDHQIIYSAVVAVYNQDQKADILLVADHLKKTDQLKRVGGTIYLYDLQARIVETENTEFHARIVRDASTRRQILLASQQMKGWVHNTGIGIDELTDEIQRKVLEIGRERVSSDYHSFESLLPDVMADVVAAKEGNPPGIPTGFTDYDILTQGLQPGEMTVIAGRPGMGKSTFVMNIAQNIAYDQDLPVAIFSLEMPKQQVGMRILAAKTRTHFSKLRGGCIADEKLVELVKETESLRSGAQNILINDDSLLNVQSLRVKARRMKTENEHLAAVIVDHLQIMRPSREPQSEYEMITEISRELKALAAELDISVIVCSQLNREVERQQNRRPKLADLRGSGGIEQDADVVAFLYRDEYYDDKTEQPGIAELLVRKHRNGATGDITLQFNPETMSFQDLSLQSSQQQDRDDEYAGLDIDPLAQ